MSRYNLLNSYPGQSKHTVKAMYTFGSNGGTTSNSGSNANWETAHRGLVCFPGDVVAMRLHLANHSASDETLYANSINFTGMYIATPTFFGSMAAATQPINSTQTAPYYGINKTVGSLLFPAMTTAADGTNVTSSWVTDRSLLPRRGVTYSLSYGMLFPTLSTLVTSSGDRGPWRNITNGPGGYAGASTAASLSAAHTMMGHSAGTSTPASFLDWRLEVVMNNMPVVFGIGDSILGSSHDMVGPFYHESALGSAAIRHGFAYTNLGIGGIRASNFATVDPTTAWKYQRVDWVTNPPDAVVLQCGYNDLNSGAQTDGQLEGSQMNVIDNVRKLAPRAKIYLTTLIPGSFTSGGSKETARQNYNAWVRGVPYGVHGIIDWDDAVNPGGLAALVSGNVVGNTFFMANGDPHPLKAGHQVISQRIPSFAN